jgi:hypothetical protein
MKSKGNFVVGARRWGDPPPAKASGINGCQRQSGDAPPDEWGGVRVGSETGADGPPPVHPTPLFY